MSYNEYLANMIKESGLTLRELAVKCKENGAKIDPSYISKLQSGSQAPASDEVNIALAKACKGNVDDLLFEAYMEKAPALLTDFTNKILDFFRQLTSRAIIAKLPKELADAIQEQLNEFSDRELIRQILEQGIPSLSEQITFAPSDEEMQDNEEIATFKHSLFGYKAKDDSMAPVIPDGSAIQINSNFEAVNNGDIVLAKTHDNSFLIRKYVAIDNTIALIPENNKYETLILKPESIKIIGIVKSVTIQI